MKFSIVRIKDFYYSIIKDFFVNVTKSADVF